MARKYKVRTPIDNDWDKNPLLEGIIESFGNLPAENESRRFAVIDDGDSLRRVYESAGLKEWFAAAEVGDGCKIEFVEVVKLDGNKTFRRFNARLWSEK